MGGYGSTRWAWHIKATTVEESRSLDCVSFRRKGFFRAHSYQTGTVTWKDYLDREIASLGFSVSTGIVDGFMELNYVLSGLNGGENQKFRYKVPLQTTQPNFGGLRWWFTCPLCNRRVRKIYRPPLAEKYLCRHCHRLTYRSSQESDQRVSNMRRLGPMGILHRMNSGNFDDLIYGFKALPDWIWQRK